MSGKFRYDIPNQRMPAPRPSRLPQQRKQPIPSKLAEKALEANPRKSNRAIAAQIGASYKTVERARNSTGTFVPPDRTVGLDGKDGKSRPARRRSERDAQPIPRNAPAINAALNWHVNELVVGQPKASRARKGGDNV